MKNSSFENRPVVNHYRTIFLLLYMYYHANGCDTLSKLITMWAVTNGCSVERSVAAVSRRTCIRRGRKLNWTKGEMCAIVSAIYYLETGTFADFLEVREGWHQALLALDQRTEKR